MSENTGEYELPNRESLEIKVEFGDKTINMTRRNTCFRFFDEDKDDKYYHVVHKTPDGRLMAFVPDNDIFEAMMEGGFPIRNEPIVDNGTIKLFTDLLEQELINCLKDELS